MSLFSTDCYWPACCWPGLAARGSRRTSSAPAACRSTGSPPWSTTASCCERTRPAGARHLAAPEQQGQQLPPRNLLRQQVLERLVMQEVQMQRAERLGIQVPDEQLNEALADVAKRNCIQFSDLPADARGAGHRLRGLPRGHAPGDDAQPAAPARRLLAHLRLAARTRPVPREAQGSPGDDVEYDLAHILVAAPAPPRRPSRPRNARRARRASTIARARARTSRSSRSPTPTPGRRSRAARSAGARRTQLPSFAAEVDRARCSRARSASRSARRAGCTSSSWCEMRGAPPARSWRRCTRGTSC